MKKLLSIILTMTLVMTMVIPSSVAFGAENQPEPATKTLEEMSISGNDSTGNLIAQELQSKQSEQEANNGCNIYSVEMTGKKAVVFFDTMKDCTVLVAIYDEDGKRMLASGKKDVKSGDTQAEITIDTSSMPKYYYLRAFLIETEDLEPLAPAYESPNYTREMVEFLGKTVNDFDSEQVVNFDSDKSNNFAVYDEDTKVIESDAGKNVVETADDKSQKYVIENIDEDIRNLKSGDIFAYEYEPGKTLIVKVKSIILSGTTATIQGQETDLEEVFSYVKIDTTATATDAEVDSSNLESGITYKGKNNARMQALGITIIDKDETDTKTLNYEINKSVFEGDLSVNLGTRIKVYINTSYSYVELSFETSMRVYLGVKGKKELDFSIGKIIFQPIPCIKVEVEPAVELNFSGKAEFDGRIRNKYGASYDSKTGFKEIKENPTVTTEINVEADFYIGLRLKPSVSVIDENIASMYLDAKGGTQVHAELLSPEKASANSQMKHVCSTCLDGDIDFKASLTFGVSILKKSAKKDLYNKTVRLADFYYSVPNQEFGWGTCPHIQYRVTVTVKDQNGKAVQGATVNGNVNSNSSGKAVLWLGNGKYKIPVTKRNYKDAEKTVTVHDRETSLTIKLVKESMGNVGGEAEPSNPGEAPGEINGSKVKQVSLGNNNSGAITEEGTLYMWGDNWRGRLGDGTTKDRHKPVKVMQNVKSISLGGTHSAAITKKGDLYIWGSNNIGQLGQKKHVEGVPVKVMSNIKAVSLGYDHSAAITKKGDLYMWGRNTDGKLGNGNAKNKWTPMKIMSNVKAVSLGLDHSAAITENGDLYMWGSNGHGQLGDGTTERRFSPVKVMDNVKSVNLGIALSAAITEDGTLYMWGSMPNGLGRHTPKVELQNVETVSIGRGYYAVITESKDLLTQGTNTDGQLGDGTTQRKTTFVKIMSNVKEVSLGSGHSAAITENGDLYTWGFNSRGQLGDGTTDNKLTPTQIYIGTRNKTESTILQMSMEEEKVVMAFDGSSEPIAQTENVAEETINEEDTFTIMSQGTSVSTAVKTKSYSKLYANTMYNFYVMKDREAKDPLASDNLLYIGQKTANSKGAATFTYGVKEACSDADIFTVATPADDLRYYKPTVKFSTYTYTGKTIKPSVSLVVHGKTLKKDRDYTVQYKDNKYVGTAAIIIEGIGDYDGTVVKTFRIVPKKPTITTVSSPAKKTVQVKWKKTNQATGYQIYASRSSKFTSPKKITVKGGTKISGKVLNLTSKKKYYVKVRAYKVVDGKTYYSGWSRVKSVTIK